jgi:phage-related protein
MPPELAIRVEFYRDEDGSKPVADFLREIDRSNTPLATRMKVELRRLQDRRNHGLPHTRQIVGRPGLFELRVRGHDDARLLFFYGAEREIVVLHGFVKKSQAIPKAELDIAMARKRRHEERQGGTAR